MRKLYSSILFFLIISVTVVAKPQSYVASSETVPTSNKTSYTAALMKFTAGVTSGIKVGFSTTPYTVDGEDVTSDITTTTKGTLTLAKPEVMGEITAGGMWYAYWIVLNNKNNLKINLSWTSDAENLFGVYEDALYKTAITNPSMLKTFESTDSGETATCPLYIKTADLRNWYYGKTYTLFLKLEVQSN